jgi:KRAB domain-containing zinc finger protein
MEIDGEDLEVSSESNTIVNLDQITPVSPENTIEYLIIEDTRNQTSIPRRFVNHLDNICPYCKTRFESSESLEIHIDLSHLQNERPYQCDRCRYLFKSKFKLINHIENIHLNKKRHKCQICERSFSESGNLKQHLLTHSKDKPMKCEFCNLGFSHSATFNAHKFKCLKLKQEPAIEIKEFKSLDELRNLISEENVEQSFNLEDCSFENDLHKCAFCERSFKKLESIQEHLKIHRFQAKTKIKCLHCDFATTNKGALASHTKVVHASVDTELIPLTKEDRDQLITCHVCSKMIKRSLIDKHLDEVHSKVFFRCPEEMCRKLFKTMKNLSQHVHGMHPVPSSKSFPCIVCGLSFPNYTVLKKHAKSHDIDKIQKCNICGAYLKNLSSLNTHKLRHSEKTFECNLCKEKFYSKQSKQAHIIKYHDTKDIDIDMFD